MTVLHRFHVEYPGTTVWLDITDRVIGDVRWTEGRNLSLLGGPLPPAVPATLQCTLDNATGFFTKGAGSAFGPGARFRMQWRATAGDAWATRFVGRYSEGRIRFQGSSRLRARFYGALIHLTGADLPARSYGLRTPEQHMTEIADEAGIPAIDRDFDTSATLYPVTLGGGYAGVVQFADTVEGFIYDTPDGKVRLELAATRTGKAVSASYTDAAKIGAEIEIPPPDVLTNPFGLLNHVNGELRVYGPGLTSAQMTAEGTDIASIETNWPGWTDINVSIPLGFFPSPSLEVVGYSFDFGRPNGADETFSDTVTALDSDLATFGNYGPVMYQVSIWVFWEFRDLAFAIIGDTVRLTMQIRGWIIAYTGVGTPPAPITNNQFPFVRNIEISVDDATLVTIHPTIYKRSIEKRCEPDNPRTTPAGKSVAGIAIRGRSEYVRTRFHLPGRSIDGRIG